MRWGTNTRQRERTSPSRSALPERTRLDRNCVRSSVSARAGSWPSKADFANRFARPGTAETVTVNSPAPGWRYLSIAAEQAVSGLVVSAEF
ncbi:MULTISPECIES: hypothetical protein [unclassified Streptomyces]|uniref:hypothetical protein n=1 Tax=unclassified Streptomyces TaxID=2593676 RepID=UPI00081E6E1D|nr:MULTISPECIES: hypothetical protein [unclassified Streptomyces]SCD35358.1 microbial collagenase [Streptomyces sp. ScaeMP-e83]